MADWAKLHTDLLDNPDREHLDNNDLAIWALLLLLTRRESPTTGTMAGWTVGRLAYRLRQDCDLIVQSLTHLSEVGWLIWENGTLTICNYLDRQYDAPSDRPEQVSARVRKHRAALVSENIETPCNAMKRVVTSGNALEERRGEEIRIDQNRQDDSAALPLPPQPVADDAMGAMAPGLAIKLDLLREQGIPASQGYELAERNSLANIRGWIAYLQNAPNVNSPTGLLVARLRECVKPPPAAAHSPPDAPIRRTGFSDADREVMRELERARVYEAKQVAGPSPPP